MAGDMLLSIRGLKTHFSTPAGIVSAVDGVSFDLERGETLGLVGESGSGKTVTALSVMKLYARPQGRIVAGQILFDGKDIAVMDDREMHEIRGNSIAMIFQEPMTSLNPVYTIGRQIVEAIRAHRKIDRKEAWGIALEALKKVGIPDPERRLKSYPHELSGGMRQRAMIAMAISCTPTLLIADEPTTALDVTIQAQILQLIRELKESMGMSVLMITHDLGVIAEVADKVAVMYGGRIAEYADTASLFAQPMHPYTRGLMDSIPDIEKESAQLYSIPGTVPSLIGETRGCRFANRCPRAIARCSTETPELLEAAPGHRVACWNRLEAGSGTEPAAGSGAAEGAQP
jgi:peptide/nickel transport system ATP-binding protein/oligopeptide transport system ATP-binding protein